MTDEPNPHQDDAPLASASRARRAQAETQLRKDPSALATDNVDNLSLEDVRRMVHELRVHQLELEMQNEELRVSQLALDTERDRYFELYDLAPVGYCTVSEHSLIMQANLTFSSLLGVLRGALVKQAITRFIHRDDEDTYYLHRQALFRRGEPRSFELRMAKADGAPLWVQMAATLAEDGDGAPEMRIAITDISARKLAQEALRASEDRYRNLFNSIDEGFCISELLLDSSGKPVDYCFIEANPSFEKQTGIPAPVGKRMRGIAPELEALCFERYDQVALTGEPMRFVIEAKTLNGQWFEVYAFRIGGDESRQVAALFTNITERKHVEQELTSAVAVAEKANLAKSEFLSSMSHELRTPLSAILGFAQLLESGTPPPTPGQKRSLDQILKAGWHLLELINEILDLAVIESGKLSLSMESIALHEVLRECEVMIEPEAQKYGISVNFADLESPVFIKADRTRAKQVLINLLSNAIKYNRAGGSVSVACTVRADDWIRIGVRDSGVGLTPEQLSQLFQPFNRLGQQTSFVEGTGIGLVVSKQLVELMGGAMGVESIVAEGSLFWYELKLTDPPQAAVLQAPSPRSRAPVGAHPSLVLYVEDNPANLLLVETFIERWPEFRFLGARDGISGVALARASHPDVILMDIDLPDISGIDALHILASSPETAKIPVIALTAKAMQQDIEAGKRAGFFRYLTKPVNLVELMNALDSALNPMAPQADSGPQTGE
jgi:PAS domain S-box-containing protein